MWKQEKNMPHILQQNNTVLPIEQIRSVLQGLADADYGAFQSALLRKPGEEQLTGSAAHYLGVRLPALRKLAKQLAKEDWQTAMETLRAANRNQEPSSSFYEELMLEGMLIGLADGVGIARRQQLNLIADFVPLVDNWGICDSFCAGLKLFQEDKESGWAFLQPFLQSGQEYEIRFGLVMLLDYFVEKEYLSRIWDVMDALDHPGYYVKMAAAWAVSICYVRFPAETYAYLQNSRLDIFTYNKALQKITESRCVSAQEKELIRLMRKKKSIKQEREVYEDPEVL